MGGKLLTEGKYNLSKNMKGILTCLLFCFISVAYSKTLMQGECSKPSDCGPGECCVLGMERYSIPECKSLATLGENCMENAEPQDRMLYYPNNEIQWVEQIHTLMCPCDSRLVCRKNVCSKP